MYARLYAGMCLSVLTCLFSTGMFLSVCWCVSVCAVLYLSVLVYALLLFNYFSLHSEEIVDANVA